MWCGGKMIPLRAASALSSSTSVVGQTRTRNLSSKLLLLRSRHILTALQSPTSERPLPCPQRRPFSTNSSSSSSQKPLTLHVERIGGGSTDNDTAVKHQNSIVFLHGLLGHGRNLKTFAKQACSVQDNKVGYLMDLRGHGQSRLNKLSGTTSEHTFAACVQDIHHTLLTSKIVNDAVDSSITLVGHSWGGRIALQYAYEQLSSNNSTPAAVSLDRLWLLDTVPGQANESVERVVNIVTRLQHESLGSKKELVERLTQQEGLDMATAQWLASSYKGSGDFGFDLQVIQGILPEFGTQDFHGMLTFLLQEAKVRVEVVRGGKNTAWDIPTLQRLESMQRQHPGLLGVHVLPKAGHWIHMDDPQGLVSLFATHQ